MSPTKPIALAALAALALAGCSVGGGGDDEPDVPAAGHEVAGDAEQGDVDVIAAWSDALREGDLDAAAGYFAIPSVADNGGIGLRIGNRRDARLFNDSLPCGARLIRADSEGEITTATFRLTERPGEGSCGPGAGGTAETAFRIRNGKIVEWRRVDDRDPGTPGQIT